MPLGSTWFCLGDCRPARQHLEQALPTTRQTSAVRRRSVWARIRGCSLPANAARTLWLLGYPEQALARSHEALALAQELSHPFSLAWALSWRLRLVSCRRDVPAVQEQAEATVALSTEQGLPQWAAMGTFLRGWALAVQGQGEAGIAQMRQGLAAYAGHGVSAARPVLVHRLADVCCPLGHPADGLQALAEALALMEQHEERY